METDSVTNIDKITYVHVRRYEPKYRRVTFNTEQRIAATGGLTLAIDNTITEMIGVPMRRVAVARCRRDEHYNKELGRAIALNKLYRKVHHLSIIDYTDKVMIERVEDSTYPGSYVYMPVDKCGQIDINKLIQYVRNHYIYERNL